MISMRYARAAAVMLGILFAVSLAAMGLYVGYVTRLWYEASGNW
jgi:hypothetical protein